MRRALVALGLCGAVGLGVGCGGSSDDDAKTGKSPATVAGGGTKGEGPTVTDGTFTLAVGADLGSFDPTTNLSSTVSGIYPFVYDTLVMPDADNKIVGNLAESWTVKPKRVTLQIRKGVTCSDGSAVTPSVVAENLEFLKSPKVGFPALGTLEYTVKADDAAGSVAISFKDPAPFPLHNMQQIQIVCGKGLENREALEQAPIGSGPYVLREAVPNDHYTFTLREDYAWGADGAKAADTMPKTFVIRIVPNQTTISNLLLADELTAATVGGSEAERLKGSGIPDVRLGTGLKLTYFNETPGRPTADERVREALVKSIDRASVAKVARAQEATSIMAPAVNPCPDPTSGEAIPAHDPAAAEQLLDEAGWAKGPDGVRVKDGKKLTLTLLGDSAEGQTIVAAHELIAEGWRKLGIDTKVRNMPEGPGLQVMASGGWDVFALFPVGVPSPAQFAPLAIGPAPPKGSNFGNIDNKEYADLVETAMNAPDEEAVCAGWNQAEQSLIEHSDVVPLIVTDTSWFVTKRADLEVNGRGIIPTSIEMHQG